MSSAEQFETIPNKEKISIEDEDCILNQNGSINQKSHSLDVIAHENIFLDQGNSKYTDSQID